MEQGWNTGGTLGPVPAKAPIHAGFKAVEHWNTHFPITTGGNEKRPAKSPTGPPGEVRGFFSVPVFQPRRYRTRNKTQIPNLQ